MVYDTSSLAMRSSAHGSNSRADVLLVVHGPAKKPVELCTVYHATNAPESTWSERSFAIIPEGRLLMRCDPFLASLLDGSMHNLARDQAHSRWFPLLRQEPAASTVVAADPVMDIAAASAASAVTAADSDAESGVDEHLGQFSPELELNVNTCEAFEEFGNLERHQDVGVIQMVERSPQQAGCSEKD